jgi:four helix bundle protein
MQRRRVGEEAGDEYNRNGKTPNAQPKLRVCLKELKETRRWLRLIRRATFLPASQLAAVLLEAEELVKIFFASVRTAEKNTP